MLTLKGLADAEQFVSRQQRLGNDVRWDGWDVVFHNPDERAVKSRAGRLRGGRWGFENRFTVTKEGTWEVDYRNVKRAKRK